MQSHDLHMCQASEGGESSMKTYTAVLERCLDTGLYVGYVPGFPGAHTQAATLDELHDNLREVIEMLRWRRNSSALRLWWWANDGQTPGAETSGGRVDSGGVGVCGNPPARFTSSIPSPGWALYYRALSCRPRHLAHLAPTDRQRYWIHCR